MSGLIAALPGIATIIIAPIFGEWGDRIGTQKILIGGLILQSSFTFRKPLLRMFGS